MPLLNIRAILAGLAVDLAGSFAAGLLIIMGYASLLAGRGLDAQQLETLLRDPGQMQGVLILLMVVGVFFDGLAGFITARMARTLEYWNALALAGLLLVLHLSLHAESAPATDAWRGWALVGGLAAVMVGAGWAKRQRLRESGS